MVTRKTRTSPLEEWNGPGKHNLHDSLLPITLYVLLAGAVIYVLLFVVYFEMISLPVRSNDGWFGPAIRGGAPDMVDMGDFYYMDEKPRLYEVFYPLCWLWLKLVAMVY